MYETLQGLERLLSAYVATSDGGIFTAAWLNRALAGSNGCRAEKSIARQRKYGILNGIKGREGR